MRSAALAAALLVTIGGFGLGGAAPEPSGEAWRAKADAFLLEAFDAGQDWLTVEVSGPPMPAPAAALPDRAAWKAHWAGASAPFLAGLREAAARAGGEVTTEVPAINAAFVRLPHDAVPALLSRAEVRRGALDWVGAMGLVDAPGEPGVAVTLGTAGTMIQVPDLWALGYRGEGIVVAVLDTGVRSTHEMMKNADGTTRVARWEDFSSNNCATPCDGNGHGTHTTTTAVGSNLFNPSSPQGMAPRATVWHGKVLDNGGSGAWEWGQDGLQWAFDNGADLTSNSWGGGCGGAATETGQLAETLADAGMVSVFAAGNAGPGPSTVHCPGLADRVITVGAVNSAEAVAGFSGRGPCTWDGVQRVCPDVMGMGVDLTAGWINSDTSYASVSGTSMSTPTVAGLVALLQQASLDLRGRGLDATKREAEVLLRYTAKDLGPANIDDAYGWGLAKGKVARDALAGAEVALRDVAILPSGEIHQGGASTLTFGVAELGGVPLDARFRVEVRQLDFGACPPACDVTVVADRALVLGQAQEALASYQFAGAAHPPGNYLATGSLTYTYVDPVDGLLKSGAHVRTSSFLVKKVVWQAQHVLPGQLPAGSVLDAGIVLANVGNEEARDVDVRADFIAQGFAPLPMVPPGAGPLGALADPGPAEVASPNPGAGVVRYIWDAGTVAPGGDWDAAYDLLATKPGSYPFKGRLIYRDETNAQFGITFDQTVVVAAPG